MAPVARRVVLTGSEATGKTTLAAALAERYGGVWVPEYARAYAEAKRSPLVASDVDPIARGQHAGEQAGLAAGTGLVWFDTDLISTALYARHYYGVVSEWLERTIAEYPPSLYLLCDVDLPWRPDGVRDRGDAREAMQALFRRTLADRGVLVRPVRGLGPDRLAAAVAAVEAWRSGA